MPLGQRVGDNSESRYCGVEVSFDDDIHTVLADNLAGGFDFVLAPLIDPKYRPSRSSLSPNDVPPFAGSDLVLSPAQWSSRVVGKISSWIDLDSGNELIRKDSEITLKQELAWATHLSLQACILPTPAPFCFSNYARTVNQMLPGLSNMQLWLRVPLVSPDLQEAEGTPNEDAVFLRRDSVSGRPVSDSWEWWNVFRMLCEHHSHLSVVLDITASLPSAWAIQRWLGEPVKAAILHTSAFLTNKKGYPCLSKRHQNLISTLFEHSVQIAVSGSSFHNLDQMELEPSNLVHANGSAGVASRHPLKLYLEYLSHLYRKLPPISEQERFELGYRDFLQAPLQPLMDNLEAQTYETFEKDTMKYIQYQRAVHAALLDRVPDSDASTTVTVLMVVGAGRGPLVRASLQVSAKPFIDVY
ncbi:hypothetical protein KP509_27G021300 [Ceratopteris richardii]|uniref:Protein arginine N-methyltransferase n=1 Tax=Ceratopteris richardii TaxID=49495 RepID=A0A8T2RGV4_CERRI|nr:hypothetical protein KP509_27G021300 [Ceratopteris richardii]